MKDGMGWDDDFTRRAGIPQYPCLIDQKHITGELYEFINVPMVVWIDEKGRVVRPAEPAGVAEDIVRAMDPNTFQIPKQATDAGKRLRRVYIDAIATGSQKATAVSSCFLKRRRAGELSDPTTRTCSRWPTFASASTCSRRAIARKR